MPSSLSVKEFVDLPGFFRIEVGYPDIKMNGDVGARGYQVGADPYNDDGTPTVHVRWSHFRATVEEAIASWESQWGRK